MIKAREIIKSANDKSEKLFVEKCREEFQKIKVLKTKLINKENEVLYLTKKLKAEKHKSDVLIEYVKFIGDNTLKNENESGEILPIDSSNLLSDDDDSVYEENQNKSSMLPGYIKSLYLGKESNV